MIYAVEILGARFVKVGFSANEDPADRIAALQTGCPYQIRPLLTTFGTLRQEQALHGALRVAFHRIRLPIPPNEWYPGRNPFFQKFLEYLKYGPDAALALAENYNPAVKQFGAKGNRIVPGDNLRWPT